MTSPSRGALGVVVADTGGSGVTWPSHNTGDLALLFCESANEPIVLTTPAGFSEVSYSPQGLGTVGGLDGTALGVFWCRATSNNMQAPVVADPGNHLIAQIATFTGVIDTGLPWSIMTGNTSSASSTVHIPGARTSHDSCLIVAVVGNGRDDSTDQLVASSLTNASLSSISAWGKAQSFVPGNGGGFNILTGLQLSKGTYTETQASLIASLNQTRFSIALRPPAPPTQPASPSSSTSQHPVKVYGASGTYVVKLTVTDATGLSSITSATVVVP